MLCQVALELATLARLHLPISVGLHHLCFKCSGLVRSSPTRRHFVMRISLVVVAKHGDSFFVLLYVEQSSPVTGGEGLRLQNRQNKPLWQGWYMSRAALASYWSSSHKPVS